MTALLTQVERPAIVVRNNTYTTPDPPWEILGQAATRQRVRRNIASVGCILNLDFPLGLQQAGTGFMVAPGCLLTNRHVILGFATDASGTWQFVPGREDKVFVDFNERPGDSQGPMLKITGILGAHNTKELDMALLSIELDSNMPPPLQLSGSPPASIQGRTVLIVGFPSIPSDPDTGTKHLQPGKLVDLQDNVLVHDCFTFPNNSGSPLIDLDSNLVIGLHYHTHMETDATFEAVPLWLRDPLLVSNGAAFVS
jgi:hypothetical protein